MNPFHPDLRLSAALFRFFPPLSVLRRLTTLRGVPRPPRLADLDIYDDYFAARDGAKLRVRVYRPSGSSATRPGLLWVHGGGYVMGSPEIHEPASIEIARGLGITVIAVSYRLAPQWPFPTPLEDCYSALGWMHRHASALDIDPSRIAVGGASAGGGLAAALAQLAYDRQEVPVKFQLLVYPMLDDRSAIRADVDHFKLRLWTQDNNKVGWTAYLNQYPGQPEAKAYSVPARRERLDALPPAWIGTGDCDLFYDENVAYARRLSEAGVACELHITSGAYHGFDVVRPQSGVAKDFRAQYLSALARGLELR
jgi:acetyl esterase/lipase